MENLKTTILKKIETKHIEQKPRWQFLVYNILGIVLGIVMFIITLFLVQFIMLTIREYTIAHGFGIVSSSIGFITTITFWFIIIVSIALIIGLYRWFRSHTHLYRYKNIYTGIMTIAIIIGTTVGIRLFDQSMQFARIGEKQIPGIHQIDQSIRPPRPNGLLSGEIIMIRDTVIAIKTPSQKIFYTQIPLFEQVQTDFKIGDRITVFGIVNGDQIDAQRIVK